eukprot:6838496-Pyramimonas_sp.AAC.1
MEARRFTCPRHPGGYLTWWSRAGPPFPVSRPHRPPRWVSNMLVPSWNHAFHLSRPPRGCLRWWSCAGAMCFHVPRSPRGCI